MKLVVPIKKNYEVFFLDSKLNFDSHIISLCIKTDQKLSALATINHNLIPH